MRKIIFVATFLFVLMPTAQSASAPAPGLPAIDFAVDQQIRSTETASGSSRPSFSLGMGGGIDSYGGNLGKLYSSAPNFDLRMAYHLSSHLSLKLGAIFSKTDFDVVPVGYTKVQFTKLGLAGQYFLIPSARWTKRKTPDLYITAGVDHVSRSQNFINTNDVQKDAAMAVNAGLGTNYFVIAEKAAVWMEAKAGKIFFSDRFSDQYLQSGISDTTGFLYTAQVGAQLYF